MKKLLIIFTLIFASQAFGQDKKLIQDLADKIKELGCEKVSIEHNWGKTQNPGEADYEWNNFYAGCNDDIFLKHAQVVVDKTDQTLAGRLRAFTPGSHLDIFRKALEKANFKIIPEKTVYDNNELASKDGRAVTINRYHSSKIVEVYSKNK